MNLDLELSEEELKAAICKDDGDPYAPNIDAIVDAAIAKAVLFLKRGAVNGEYCWCGMAIDVPYMKEHSPQCQTVRAFLEAAGIPKPAHVTAALADDMC